MKVAVLGRTRMLYETIDCMIAQGHQVVLIGTCKAAPEYDVTEVDFEMKAKSLGVPFFCDSRINSSEIQAIIAESGADIAVSVNWLTIINEQVIALFKYGILNAHCGDLPRYRGNACPNWAIIKGEDRFAISIHYMEPGELDAGDIVVKNYYPITTETTITDIYAIADNDIPKMFAEAINKIENNDITMPQSKNRDDALRCYPRIPSDSFIDWNAKMVDIGRLIRASCKPFSGAYTYFDTHKLHILGCRSENYEFPCYVMPGQVTNVDKISGEVKVACADGVIVFDKIIEDGVLYKATDIINSTRIRLNYSVQDEIYALKKMVERMGEDLNES